MDNLGAGVGSEVAAVPKVVTPPAAGAEGNQTLPNGSGPNGSGAAPAAITPSPEAENLEFAKAKGWVNDDGTYKVPDVLKGYQTLEQHLGKTVVVPDEKATPEEREAFARKIGWTGKPEDYTFAPPADMPAELPYSSDLADAFKAWAIEDKVPVSTAKSMHDRFVKFQIEALSKDVAAYAQTVQSNAKAANEVVIKEWGEPGSTKHVENTEAAKRALSDPKLSGFRELLTANGLLTKAGEFTNFGIAHLLASHGQQFKNDTFIAPGTGGNQVGNPFQKTLSDGTENPAYNLTIGGQLVKQNPNEARRLIQQAGEDPGLYGL